MQDNGAHAYKSEWCSSCQTAYFNLNLSNYIQNIFIKNWTQQMANAREVFINTGGLGPSLKINKTKVSLTRSHSQNLNAFVSHSKVWLKTCATQKDPCADWLFVKSFQCLITCLYLTRSITRALRVAFVYQVFLQEEHSRFIIAAYSFDALLTHFCCTPNSHFLWLSINIQHLLLSS